jgi:hypothetical protein
MWTEPEAARIWRDAASDAGGDEPLQANASYTDEVLELLGIWAALRDRHAAGMRILAWNWEWAYWYADPQAEIAARFPAGVELLVDLEIGGTRAWGGRQNYIGECSLGYAGPGERFVATCRLVRTRNMPIPASGSMRSHDYKYSAAMIRAKITAMAAELGGEAMP